MHSTETETFYRTILSVEMRTERGKKPKDHSSGNENRKGQKAPIR